MSIENQLTLALSKGRILDETLPLLAEIGIEPLEDVSKSRKLVFATNQPHIRLLIIRASDVPTYVELGAADLGISGKDVLMEHGGNGLYEPVDLGIARCRLMLAARQDAEPVIGRKRVATKYVNITRDYFAQLGEQVDIIKLYGAMELAPIMGLSDYIVDVVDTGSTLRANGLEPIELVADDISSRLIVGVAAMKLKHALIHTLIEKLEALLSPKTSTP